MAQEIVEEDQFNKRRKWMKNLSVLSSDDEEEYLCARVKNEEGSILSNDKVIYLRFPYHMGSDNSDDEDDINCSPKKFPSKREKSGIVSSSDEKNEISKGKLTYKHSKRKSKKGLKNEPGLNLSSNNKENKDSLKRNLRSRHKKSTYKSREGINSSKYNISTKNHLFAVPSSKVKDKTKKPSKTTSLNLRKTRAFGSADGNLIDEKEINNEECKFREDEDDEFQSKDQTSNRFLDSSSENSNTEIITKPKRPKYRRVRCLSTSSSSSNNEEDTVQAVQPQNLQTSGDADSENDSCTLQTNVKPAVFLSSEEDNNSDSLFEPSIKSKSENVFKSDCNKETTVGTSAAACVTKAQTIKSTINSNAWKSIAIAHIKAQFNKQSKVEELKRKLVPSNASSVAIYKKIQKRQMFTNHYTKLQRPITKPQLSQKHAILQEKERISCEPRLAAIPTTSDYQTQKQTLIGTPLRDEAKEINDAIILQSPGHLSVPESRTSLTEKSGENTENLNLPNSQLQSNLEPLDSDTGVPVYNKKIRQAHNSEPKNPSENCGSNKFNLSNKVSSSNLKHTQSPNENKLKISKQISSNTSTGCDVLGNILSQMDNNRYKVQKPFNKKVESSPEMLGWFPAGTSTSPLFGQIPIAAGVQSNSTELNEIQSKHNLLIGMHMPAWTNRPPPVTINNVTLPSYNPLAFNINTKQSNFGITKHTDNQIRNQEASKVSNNQPFLKNCKQNQENATSISPKVSSEANMILFYSAPQEDYVGREISKTKMHSVKEIISEPSSDCKTESQNSHDKCIPLSLGIAKLSDRLSNMQYKNNNEKDVPLSLNKAKLSDRLSNMQSQNNNEKDVPLSSDNAKLSDRLSNMQRNKHHTKASNVPKANFTSKYTLSSSTDSLSSANRKENTHQLAKSDTKSVHLKKLNSEMNIFLTTEQKDKPGTIRYFQPHVPSSFGVPRGNGAIHNAFKRNSLGSNNNIVQKGIRVRFGGTEYRITPKESDNLATKASESDANFSDKGPSEASRLTEHTSCLRAKTSSINSLGVKATPELVVKNMENETEEALVESGSSSSSSSSPPSSYSSSSPTDSSSESSEDSEKSSSSKSSASNTLEASNKFSMFKRQINIDKSNQKIINAENDHPQNNSLKPNSLTRDRTKKSPITRKLNNRTKKRHEVVKLDLPQASNNKVKEKESSTNIRIDEVIILSGSSDSDLNDQPHHKEIPSQKPDKVSMASKPHENRIGPQEDRTVVNTLPESEECNIISDKVGKIRVKSLKELGVVHGTPVIENALELTKVCDKWQLLRKENQTKQLDRPSCSTVNIETHNNSELEEAVSNIQLPPKSHEKLNPGGHQPLKKTANPVNTIYLPVVPIAVINPLNSARVIPKSSNQGKNLESNAVARSGNSSQVGAVTVVPLQGIPSQTVVPVSGEPNNQEASQSSAWIELTPSLLPPACGDIASIFFKRCDELFTDVVLFKIPKLADDLHLLIAYDIMKDERLRKIEQLISPETIVCEKRRAEKDFADMIKVRGHSFVPLFMTIMNRIDKENLKTLATAVYCRIVQQLERLDPVNCIYRYKIREIIKSMLLKHSSGVRPDILAYFDEETNTQFLAHFIFIENLLSKYDKYLEKQKEIQSNASASETSHPAVETQESNNPTRKENQDGNPSANLNLAEDPLQSSLINFSASNTISAQTPNVHVKPTPPKIGNLDKLFLKKNVQK